MKRLSHVLVAVALDDRDRRVFAHALALARRHDAKLLLLHATSPEMSLNRGATERVEFLRQLRSLAEAAGVDIRVAVQTGPVHEIILLHARARNTDLIVLGTGRKESRRGLSGWIAEQVLRASLCPTLVVPEAWDAGERLEQILYAVDFPSASQAVTYDVVQPLIPYESEGAAVARVAPGRPAAEILGAARRTRLGSTLFGKTGQLLRDAKCAILAVPVAAIAKQGTQHLHKEAA